MRRLAILLVATALNIFASAQQIPYSAQVRYIPHVVSGGGFVTRITITNLGNAPNNAVLNFISQSGALVSSTKYALAAGGNIRVSTPEANRFSASTVQWAAIGADFPVSVNVFFELINAPGSNAVVNTIGFNDASPLSQFTIPVEFQPPSPESLRPVASLR